MRKKHIELNIKLIKLQKQASNSNMSIISNNDPANNRRFSINPKGPSFSFLKPSKKSSIITNNENNRKPSIIISNENKSISKEKSRASKNEINNDTPTTTEDRISKEQSIIVEDEDLYNKEEDNGPIKPLITPKKYPILHNRRFSMDTNHILSKQNQIETKNRKDKRKRSYESNQYLEKQNDNSSDFSFQVPSKETNFVNKDKVNEKIIQIKEFNKHADDAILRKQIKNNITSLHNSTEENAFNDDSKNRRQSKLKGVIKEKLIQTDKQLKFVGETIHKLNPQLNKENKVNKEIDKASPNKRVDDKALSNSKMIKIIPKPPTMIIKDTLTEYIINSTNEKPIEEIHNPTPNTNRNFKKVDHITNLTIDVTTKANVLDFPIRRGYKKSILYSQAFFRNSSFVLNKTISTHEREGINYTHNKIIKPVTPYQTNRGVYNKTANNSNVGNLNFLVKKNTRNNNSPHAHSKTHNGKFVDKFSALTDFN